MKQDVIFSVSLHLVIAFAVFFAAPFSMNNDLFDESQVIRIRAISLPELENMLAVSLDPVVTPQAVIEDVPLEIPIDDPTSVDKPKVIDKPVEKPKPKETKKPKKTTNTKKVETSGAANTEKSSGKEIETSNSSGSAFAGAKVSDDSFNHPYWFTQADRLYSQNLRKTVSVDGYVTCDIYFEVIKSGRIIKTELVKSSGYSSIDQDCLNAFERIKKFPPLPNEFRNEILGITLTIKY